MSGLPLESDVVELVVHDHEVLRRRVTGFNEVPNQAWPERLTVLTRSLVRHEMAEQRVIYPALRSKLVSGKSFGGELLAQETELETMLDSLEGLEPVSEAFAAGLDKLQTLVLEHLRDEQIHVLPLLHEFVDAARRSELGEKYVRAMAAAPVHPHPHLPNAAPGNVVAGPIAALTDRFRDGAAGLFPRGNVPNDQSTVDQRTEPRHERHVLEMEEDL